ncbi:MAG: BatD family protein [Syntrophobacteraceae bacterium]
MLVLKRFAVVAAVVIGLAWGFGFVNGVLVAGCGVTWAASEVGVSARAIVETNSVSVGEPFLLQIRLEGSDVAPGTEKPDMSGIAHFTVEYLGGQSNNSSSITIVNGKVSKVESFGYVYSYRLTPKKTGEYKIPPIEVPLNAARSNTLRTQVVPIRVTEPEATDDFHLELKYSKTSFYVGEPVLLTVVWYLAKDVESVAFNIPILQDDAFVVVDPKSDQDPRKQYFQIPVGSGKILAEKGSGVSRGKQYTTLTFSKVIFARRPGTYETAEATVSSKALVGHARRQQGRSPFDSFFDDDFFNTGKKGIYKSFVSRSAPVTLTARALPEEGKPPGFSGWVGRFQVEASANPTEASVGDPVTLGISVRGSAYLDNVELPPLAKIAELENDFKIPEEMASGVVHGDAKRFTQTLRPKSEDVKAIPALAFPYFDADTGRYEIARTKPIPLTVKPTRVLTSADVEGKAGGSAVRKSELESRSQGIAYNYEGPEVLERHVYRIATIVRSPLWLAAVLLPFLGFVALVVTAKVRERQMADSDKLKSRKALARFKKLVGTLGAERSGAEHAFADLLDAVRSYFGDKLRSSGSALTYADIEARLKGFEIDSALSERLRKLFEACEQATYGGSSLSRPWDELVKEAVDVVAALDRVIR